MGISKRSKWNEFYEDLRLFLFVGSFICSVFVLKVGLVDQFRPNQKNSWILSNFKSFFCGEILPYSNFIKIIAKHERHPEIYPLHVMHTLYFCSSSPHSVGITEVKISFFVHFTFFSLRNWGQRGYDCVTVCMRTNEKLACGLRLTAQRAWWSGKFSLSLAFASEQGFVPSNAQNWMLLENPWQSLCQRDRCI